MNPKQDKNQSQDKNHEQDKNQAQDTHLKKKEKNKLWTLFLSTLYISAFTFGGGFVIVSMMKKKFVDELHWIDEKEMLDYTAMAQSSPGAIAVNAAILVGRRVAGGVGMLVAIMGTILPPMVILAAISFCYAAVITNPYVAMVLKGMQAGVAAVVLDVACGLCGKLTKEKNYFNMALMVVAFVAAFFFDINVIYIILGAAVVGLINVLWNNRQGKEEAK